MLRHSTIKKADEEDSEPFWYHDGSFPVQQPTANTALSGWNCAQVHKADKPIIDNTTQCSWVDETISEGSILMTREYAKTLAPDQIPSHIKPAAVHMQGPQDTGLTINQTD